MHSLQAAGVDVRIVDRVTFRFRRLEGTLAGALFFVFFF
jgi:hypothetical protein